MTAAKMHHPMWGIPGRKRIGFRRTAESTARKELKAAALALESKRYLIIGIAAAALFALLNSCLF